MLKFVLPVLMVAASSAQTFFYPTTSSSIYRYGSDYSSYYPTYMPTTYVRSGYFYPYSRTHMTMTYPTFMARSDGTTYDAVKPDVKPHYVPRPVDVSAVTVGTHVPHGSTSSVSGTPVHHRHDQVAVAVPATFAYPVSYPGVPVPAPVGKDFIPTVTSEGAPVATTSTHHRHVPHHVSQPAMAYAVPVPANTAYPVQVAFEYPTHVSSGRVEPSPVGMTGGAAFIAASAVPVDVKSGFEVPAQVTSSHHEGKHNNFEGKKSSNF